MRIPLLKYVTGYLAFAMFIIGIIPRVDAAFVPSEIITHPQIDRTQIDRTADLQKIQKVLETKMVRERLDKLGFTKEEIQKRLSQLTDGQIHTIALNLNQLKVGGKEIDSSLGVVIALLVIAVFVALFIQLFYKKSL